MAGRVNTRFVIGLLVVVTVASVGIAAWYYFGIRRDPGHYITQANAVLADAKKYLSDSEALTAKSAKLRAEAYQAELSGDKKRAADLVAQSQQLDAQGRELVAKADYERAAALLRRAYGCERNNQDRIKIIKRLAEVYGDTPPKDMEEARTLVLSVEQCWAKIIQLDSQHVQAAERLLEMNHERAAMFPQLIQLWNQLYTRASDVLAFAPDNPTARRYRGIALVNRIERLNLGEEDRTTARGDLLAAIEFNPDDSEVVSYLCNLDVLDAQELRRINKNAQADAIILAASDRLDKFIEEHPENVAARLSRFRFALRIALSEGSSGWQEKAIAKLRSMGQMLVQSGDVKVTREVASLLADLDQELITLDDGSEVRSGLYLAEKLLSRLVREDPSDVVAWTSLGLLYKRQGEIDKAIAVLNEAKVDRPLPVSAEAFRAADFRVAAMRELVDIYVGQFEHYRSENKPKAASEAWAKAEAEAAGIEELRGDKDALTLLAKGKLALASGDAVKAVKYLYDANVQLDSQQYEVLLLLAQAYQRTGETGAAADAYEKLLRTNRGARIPAAYLQLARLKLRAGESEQAVALANRLLALMPDNSSATVLKAAAMLQSAGNDQRALSQAIAESKKILQPLADAGDRAAIFQLAGVFRAEGNLAQARELLLGYYENNPSDSSALQQLIGLDQQLDETPKAVARVEAAIERDPDNRIYPLLLASLRGESIIDMTEQLADAMADQSDPVIRQLSLWRLYAQAGHAEQAQEALDQAKKLDPKHPQVLQVTFDQALNNGDVDEARRIVEIVSTMNQGQGLDYARGAFWRARVQLLERDYTQAITTLERGLEQMPTDSSAWTLLGGARTVVGDLNNAERALKRAIDLRPDSINAWQRLHRVHDLRQEYDLALEDLRRAVKYAGGRNLNLYLTFLDYLGQHGDVREAIAAREKLARRLPSVQENRRALAELYLRNRQSQKAKAELTKLLDEDPGDLANVAAMAVYLSRDGQLEKGSKLLLDHIHQRQNANRDTYRDWLVLARFMRQSGQNESALSAYHAAIKKDDSSQLVATRELADWLYSRQEYAAAAGAYQRLLDSAQDDPADRLIVWRQYVEALLSNNQLEQAKEELAKLLQKYPADARSYMIKGMLAERLMTQPNMDAARKQQLHEQAETAYNQAVRYAPNVAASYAQRARFRMSNRADRVQLLVRDDLRKAIELDTRAILPRELLVQWHLNQGEPEKAIAEQERLVSLNPRYVRGIANLAELYLADGRDLVKLAKLLDDAQELQPDLPAWYQYRARLYRLQNRPKLALEQLRKAYERDSSPGRLVEYTGLLLVVKDFDKALALLNDRPDDLARVAVMEAMRGRALIGLGRRDDGYNAFRRAIAIGLQDGSQGSMGSVVSQIQASLKSEELLALLEPLAEQDSSGVLTISVAQLYLIQGQHKQAITSLKAVEGRLGQDEYLQEEFHRLMARANYENGNFAEARTHYERVLELNEMDLVSLNNLAYLLADNLDDAGAALALAERAIGLVGNSAPQKANILDTLGWVQFRAGMSKEAIDSLQKSVRLHPMVPNRLHLAKVYMATDRPTAARRELIAAREIAEESKDTQALNEIDALLQQWGPAAVDSQR